MEPLVVEVPEFTGPLDLLLSLIQNRRLDVTALSLAAVADQYLERVLAMEGELNALSEFLAVASQLLLIKSRALLPAPAVADEDGDPAEALRRRLAEYQVLQAAVDWLGQRESEGLRSWPRGGELSLDEPDRRLAPIASTALARLLAQRLQRAPPSASTATTQAPTRPTLRERAAVLTAAATTDAWRRIDDLLGPDVQTVVATFLALLALVRQGALLVRQERACGTLEIRLAASRVPDTLALELVG